MQSLRTQTHPGLRERKKRETRARIVDSAVQLFAERGFGHTTIPAIAAAADVSPRTVSSYFPVKEELLFDQAAETFDRLEEELEHRAPGENFATVLRRWLIGQLPHWEGDMKARELRHRVITGDPHLSAYGQRYIARGEAIVAAAIARDLACQPGDIEARMAAAATIAIFAEFEPGAHGDDEYTADEALGLLDRALLFVEGGIRALQARN